jgi:hypothetical protein
MQLNELIEHEGIENVSNKTTISQDNLKYMMAENFEKLSRVKALGFLVILEREYKELELEDYRERVKSFFEENKPDHDNVIVISETAISNGGGVSFFKWFVLLAILLGAWYLYSEGKLDSLLQNVSTKEDIYTDSKALESNTSIEEAKKVSVIEDSQEPVSIVAPIEPKINLDAVSSEDKNITIVKSTIDEAKASVVEEVVSPSTMSEEEAPVSKISTITINPTRGMLWFGFINVDTKKKKEFMKQVSTPFDINDGRWILVTGHGFVDVVSEVESVEVSDRNKHYFYIDSNELKEISQKEFRDLNDGHGWI